MIKHKEARANFGEDIPRQYILEQEKKDELLTLNRLQNQNWLSGYNIVADRLNEKIKALEGKMK